MQVPVLVEPISGNGFRARSGEPLSISADGATPDDALRNLCDAMDRQLQGGKRIVAVDVPGESNPWLAMAGMHDPNDPLVQEWKAEMARYRDEVESDPDRP